MTVLQESIEVPLSTRVVEENLIGYFESRRGNNGIISLPLRVSLSNLGIPARGAVEHHVQVTVRRQRDEENLNDEVAFAWNAVGSPGHAWIDPYGNVHARGNFPYAVGFLAVEYTNDAAKPAHEIDFGLVSRGSLIALAKDVGTFSPGARINHEFSLDPEAFPIGTTFPYCAVMRVKYAGRDGVAKSEPTAAID